MRIPLLALSGVLEGLEVGPLPTTVERVELELLYGTGTPETVEDGGEISDDGATKLDKVELDTWYGSPVEVGAGADVREK